jgi:hypothetical protein
VIVVSRNEADAELGAKICAAFDAFVAAPQVRGRETWSAFLDRVHATVLKDDPRAFEGLLWVLANKKGCGHQNVAGSLLTQFEIPCRIGLDAFAELILLNFNASARETVRYLVKSFGQEAVWRRIRALQSSELTANERRTLDCLRYWLGEHPGSG